MVPVVVRGGAAGHQAARETSVPTSARDCTAEVASSFRRQRARVGPMLPIGSPSSALIWAYGTAGSADQHQQQVALVGLQRRQALTDRCLLLGPQQVGVDLLDRGGEAELARVGLALVEAGDRLQRGGPPSDLDQPVRLPLRGDLDPARQGPRLADRVQVAGQLQPHGLADIGGVLPAQPVTAGDRVDDRLVALDELGPAALVTLAGAGTRSSMSVVTVVRVTFTIVVLSRAVVAIGQPSCFAGLEAVLQVTPPVFTAVQVADGEDLGVLVGTWRATERSRARADRS